MQHFLHLEEFEPWEPVHPKKSTGGPKKFVCGCQINVFAVRYSRPVNALVSTSLSELLATFAKETGVAAIFDHPDDVHQGLEQLSAELALVGAEAHAAALRGVSLQDAVQKPARYPALARFHASCDDLLMMTLPPDVANWVEHLLHLPQIPFYDEIRTFVLSMAKNAESPQLRALYRFIAVQLVRVHLVVDARSNELTRKVPIDEFPFLEIAEGEVDWYAEHLDGSISAQDFYLVLASALLQLAQHYREFKEALAQCNRDVREAMERRARLDRALADMDAADAVLIRNGWARELGDVKIRVDRLQELHPLLYGKKKRNAIDQQHRRVKKAIETNGIASTHRKGPNLLEMLTGKNSTPPSPASKKMKKVPT